VSPFLHRRLSDELLGSRLAAGEAAAFDELYRRYVHRLAAYGAHLLGDSALGDDVSQATLLKAYAALRDGRGPDRMRPWLYRIAHNTALDLLARRRELLAAEVPEAPARSESQTGALVAALAALPDRQRQVYVLRELHGLRIDETAAELGLAATQVEQALFAARNRLAEHLVFGDRLDCVAVRRLSAGPLDGQERRALKTHLRSCASCRADLGLRGRALSLLPVLSADWLRGLAGGLAGGGAPAAAKIGAVVATAGIAAGVPGAMEAPRRDVHLVHPAARVAIAPSAPARRSKGVARRHAAVAPRPASVALVARRPSTRSEPVEREHTSGHGRDEGEHTAAGASGDRAGHHGDRSGPGDDDTASAPAPVPEAEPEPVVTTTSSSGPDDVPEAPAPAPVATTSSGEGPGPSLGEEDHGGDGGDVHGSGDGGSSGRD
jgi:RNA polymerase sigma factor (sigma-70 family)